MEGRGDDGNYVPLLRKVCTAVGERRVPACRPQDTPRFATVLATVRDVLKRWCDLETIVVVILDERRIWRRVKRMKTWNKEQGGWNTLVGYSVRGKKWRCWQRCVCAIGILDENENIEVSGGGGDT